MENINIRNCRAVDYRFVYDLSRRNMAEYVKKYWGKWDARRFKANLKKENIKIINSGKRKIGFFDISRDGSTAYLHNIQIIGSFQGKGIGAKMMNLIEKGEKTVGVKKIRTQVFKKNPTKLFYHKLGYKTVKRNIHSIVMEKIL